MTALNSFHKQIRSEVKGCSEIVIDNALYNSIVEFFMESLCWQVQLPNITLVNGTSSYTPAPIAGRMHKIMWARHDDQVIHPLTEQELMVQAPGWHTSTSNLMTHFTQEDPRTLRVIPVPDSGITGNLIIKAALVPLASENTIVDHVAEDNFEAIAAGAKWKLMAMPDVVWSNLKMAAYYEAIYIRGKGDAKTRALKSYTRRSLTAQPVEFGY